MAQRGSPKLLALAKLREALRTDRVLSASQVKRYFGLDWPTLETHGGLVLFYCVVEPIFDSAKTQQIVHFVTLERRLYQRLSPEQIGHLAGTAELRLVSGYSPEVWSSAASALGKGGQPDAVLTLPPHRVAVEFDTGSYPGKVVQKKLAVFSQEYDGLIWGVTGKVRYQRFVERYQALGVKVIQARWW